jgi:hypothetical protein
VVVDDLDVPRSGNRPPAADSPLLIDPDAIKPSPVSS